MHHTATITPAFAQLLRLQQGTFLVSQAEGLALDEKTVNRLVQRGIWFRHARGLYAITPTLTWHQQAWSGVLLGGTYAVVSGLAAAYLDGYTNQPDEICVYSPRRVSMPLPGLVFRRGIRRGHGELPRARAESAIIDAAALLREPELISLLSNALHHHKTTPQRILAELELRPRTRQRRLLRELLGDVSLGIESTLEMRFFHDVEQVHGLPRARRQVHTRKGRRLDVLYDCGLIIELDGRLGHTGADVARDRQRDNDHLLHGALTLRYGWTEVVSDPCRVAAEISSVLHTLGWTGEPHHCPRCK